MKEIKKVRPCLGHGILSLECEREFLTTKNRRICDACTEVKGLVLQYHALADDFRGVVPMQASGSGKGRRVVNGWVRPCRSSS